MRTSARIFAVLFALSVLSALVWVAQRASNPSAAPKAEDGPQELQFVEIPPGAGAAANVPADFLPSTKAALPPEVFLPSSKAAPPPVREVIEAATQSPNAAPQQAPAGNR